MREAGSSAAFVTAVTVRASPRGRRPVTVVPGGAAPGGESRGLLRAWYVAAVLTLAYICSIVDRQILSLLVEPVKHDLGINDTAFGLLHGAAFGLFYSLVGIPIARLADRANRRNIIVVGVVLWSFATAACGLARNFASLFVGRLSVGIGEAALTPAAMSILADVFPRERLAAPISVYTMGAFWGTGVAYALGGAVVQLVAKQPVTIVPVIGELHSWQLTFFAVALPGLLLVPLLLTIREPGRRELGASAMSADGVAAAELTRVHWRALVALYAGFSLLLLATVTVFAWMPAVFIRRFGWSAADVGYAFGLIVLLAGTLGINLGGIFTDRLVRRGCLDAPLGVAIGSVATVAVLLAMVPNAPSASAVIIGCVPLMFVLAFPAGAGMAAIQAIVPNRMRAQMVAVFVLVSNLTAMLLGPPLVGLCADYLFGDPQSIGAALSLVCGSAAVAAVAVLAWGARHYRSICYGTAAGRPGGDRARIAVPGDVRYR